MLGVISTVIYIKEANTKGYIRVGVELDGVKHHFTVTEAEYREAGSPLTRDILTRDTFSALQYGDMRYRAMLKALRILSFGDNSELMLSRKLFSAGFSRDIIEEAVSECVRLGYINSKRQLKNLIINEVNNKNQGMAKIVPKLISKGYRRADIEEVADMLSESGEIDFSGARERLILKLGENPDSEKIKKTLYKNGHTGYDL